VRGGLFGYTKLYGQVPGGQAEFLRVPHADYGLIKVPEGPPDDRFLFLSDVLPTAWQGVHDADVPADGSLVVLGLGPIGDMCCRIAQHLGVANVMAIDLVSERLARARGRGIDVLDLEHFEHDHDVVEAVRHRTGGRGPDAEIDAVGMEAHGSPAAKAAHMMTRLLPDAVGEKLMRKAGVDRLAALPPGDRPGAPGRDHLAAGWLRRDDRPDADDDAVRQAGADSDGPGNIRRWVDDILLLLADDDPPGFDTFATHHQPLADAPDAYSMFQKEQDGAVKVVFRPSTGDGGAPSDGDDCMTRRRSAGSIRAIAPSFSPELSASPVVNGQTAAPGRSVATAILLGSQGRFTARDADDRARDEAGVGRRGEEDVSRCNF